MTTHNALIAALDKSLARTISEMRESEIPAGIDAVRLDIALHTPHGWHSPITGTVVSLDGDVKLDLSGDVVEEK